MSTDTAYLTRIARDVQYLKALMARAAAGTPADDATADPAIDFCADFFDRPNQPVLNGHWSGDYSQWSIRNAFLVPNATPIAGNAVETTITYTLQSQSTFGGSLSGTIDGVPVASTPILDTQAAIQKFESGVVIGIFSNASVFTEYRGNFRSPDMTVRITFEVPQDGVVTEASQSTDNSRTRRTAAGTYGAYFADSAGHKFGTALSVMPALTGTSFAVAATGSGGILYQPPGGGPMQLTPASSSSLPATETAVHSTGAIFGYVGDFSSLAKPIFRNEVGGSFTSSQLTVIESGAYTPDFLGGTTKYTTTASLSINRRAPDATRVSFLTGEIIPLVLVGENELLVTAVGDVYTFRLNGVPFALETGNYITRTRTGIGQGRTSMLANLVASGVPIAGITSFKAWRTDMPEPPNQTGRGTFEGGNFVYNDRYHTADSNGNVVYNPLA